MRLILVLYLTALSLSPLSAWACDTLSSFNQSEPIERSTAEENLSRFLLEPQSTLVEERPPLNATLDAIDCYLIKRSSQLPELEGVNTQILRLARGVTSASDETTKANAIVELNNRINRDSGTGYIEFPSGPESSFEIALFEDLVQASCTNEASTECTQSLNLAANLWWIANYMRTIPDYFNDENIIDSLAFNERLNKKWLSYKDDTILLWPQEVALNSIVFKQEQRGFSEPPAYKLMAFRPSLGLSYLSDQDHRLQPTLNIDLLGIYWWKYGGPDGVKAQPGKGLSISMVWDGSDTAYGLSYHHNPKWSATIASGDDNDVVVSLSFQLAAWLIR